MKLTVEPFKHQKNYLKFAMTCNYTLLGDQMGLARPSQQ